MTIHNDLFLNRLEEFSSIAEEVIIKVTKNQQEFLHHFEHLSKSNNSEIVQLLKGFKHLVDDLKDFRESTNQHLKRCYDQ